MRISDWSSDVCSSDLLLLGEEGAALERLVVGSAPRLRLHVLVGLAQEAGRAAGAVIDPLADPRLHHPDHGADERARRVVLAAVAPGIAHVADLRLVEMRELVLLDLRAEAQAVDQLQRVAQGIAGEESRADLGEDLADLVLDRVGTGGGALERLEVGPEGTVHIGDEVVAGQRRVVVEGPVGLAWGGPGGPAVAGVEDRAVGAAGDDRKSTRLNSRH